jgi:hypothetical protein
MEITLKNDSLANATDILDSNNSFGPIPYGQMVKVKSLQMCNE